MHNKWHGLELLRQSSHWWQTKSAAWEQ
jgi:hypothetical protein